MPDTVPDPSPSGVPAPWPPGYLPGDEHGTPMTAAFTLVFQREYALGDALVVTGYVLAGLALLMPAWCYCRHAFVCNTRNNRSREATAASQRKARGFNRLAREESRRGRRATGALRPTSEAADGGEDDGASEVTACSTTRMLSCEMDN